MNKRFIIFLAIISALTISWQWSHNENPTKHLEDSLPHASYGLVLYDATADKILINHLGDRYFIPASVAKLFTAERVLKKLGPDHRFETELYVNGPIVDSNLKGDVIFKGGGDPLFDEDGLIHFAKTLRGMGIKQIQGSIVVQDESYIHPHTEVEDLVHPYFAKYSLMNLNRNAHTIHFIPTEAGQEAIASSNEFECHVITASSNEEVDLPEVKTSFFDPVTRIEGKITDPYDLLVPTHNLPHFISLSFKEVLHNEGIEVLSQSIEREDPIKVASHHSKPVSYLVNKMVKESDNHIAHVLTLLAPIEESPYQLKDGAGLSRHNKLTPLEVVDILKNDDLNAYLPVAGIEGSLKKRLKETFLDKKLLAKTGGMEGMSNLAGYWINSKGHKMILVFMLNNSPKSYKESCKAIDNFLNLALKEYD